LEGDLKNTAEKIEELNIRLTAQEQKEEQKAAEKLTDQYPLMMGGAPCEMTPDNVKELVAAQPEAIQQVYDERAQSLGYSDFQAVPNSDMNFTTLKYGGYYKNSYYKNGVVGFVRMFIPAGTEVLIVKRNVFAKVKCGNILYPAPGPKPAPSRKVVHRVERVEVPVEKVVIHVVEKEKIVEVPVEKPTPPQVPVPPQKPAPPQEQDGAEQQKLVEEQKRIEQQRQEQLRKQQEAEKQKQLEEQKQIEQQKAAEQAAKAKAQEEAKKAQEQAEVEQIQNQMQQQMQQNPTNTS
jgi:type IV secretory pathway VirB10-like protein